MKFVFVSNDPIVRWAIKPAVYSSDCGIDLVIPDNIIFQPGETILVDLKIACQLKSGRKLRGYFLVPRSSISKTPLILRNSVGIIDPEYTGTLKISLWNTSTEQYSVSCGTRLVQVVAPDLKKCKCKFVEKFKSSKRGSNGFGSTNSKAD